MAAGAVPESSSHPMLSGAASLAIHGGLVIVAVVVAGDRTRAPSVVLTPIEMVEVPPPPPPPPPPPVEAAPPTRSVSSAGAGTLGRRGRDAPQRSQTRAPATPDPYADIVVSYDTPTGPDPGNEAGTTGAGLGAGLHGAGVRSSDGAGQFGVGDLAVPPPPRSLARPPRPRSNYSRWNPHADRRFAGAVVLVELSIDPRGQVRKVSVLRGVDGSIDAEASDLARRFEFYPALDDAGQAVSARYRWEFVLQPAQAFKFQR